MSPKRLVLLVCCFVAVKELAIAEVNDRPIVLQEIVVRGTKIPSGWLTVSWECKGTLPISAVKRAWVSNVLPESPADEAGVSIDDVVIAIAGVPVTKMTGVALRWTMEHDREPGTEEEFLFQRPDGEQRRVVLRFESKR